MLPRHRSSLAPEQRDYKEQLARQVAAGDLAFGDAVRRLAAFTGRSDKSLRLVFGRDVKRVRSAAEAPPTAPSAPGRRTLAAIQRDIRVKDGELRKARHEVGTAQRQVSALEGQTHALLDELHQTLALGKSS